MITVYDAPGSGNGYKVRLLLTFLDVPFRTEWLDLLKGETHRPDFLAINPNGKIPAVRWPDGRARSESNALLYYFAQGTSWWPDGIEARADVLQWLFFEQYTHEPAIAVLRFWRHFLPPSLERTVQIPAKEAQGRHALGVLEGGLVGRDWLLGEGPTIADVALYAYTHVADEAGFDLAGYPAISAWCARIAGLPDHVAMMDGVPFQMHRADVTPAR